MIWLVVGNAGTAAIGKLLLSKQPAIEAFVHDPEEAFLILRLDAA